MATASQIAIIKQIGDYLKSRGVVPELGAIGYSARLYDKSDAPGKHTMLEDVGSDSPWNTVLDTLYGRARMGYLACLIGEPGVGKTQLAQRVIMQAVALGRTAKYCTAVELFQAVQSSYHSNSPESSRQVIAKYKTPRLLVIDDVHAPNWSVAKHEVFGNLLDKRYADVGADTILIANLSQGKMRDLLGKAIVDRLEEIGGFLDCNWPSFRKRKVSESDE